MAEREGFEPSERLRAQRFSRPPRSTTPAPLRKGRHVFWRRGTYTGGHMGARPRARISHARSQSCHSRPQKPCKPLRDPSPPCPRACRDRACTDGLATRQPGPRGRHATRQTRPFSRRFRMATTVICCRNVRLAPPGFGGSTPQIRKKRRLTAGIIASSVDARG